MGALVTAVAWPVPWGTVQLVLLGLIVLCGLLFLATLVLSLIHI